MNERGSVIRRWECRECGGSPYHMEGCTTRELVVAGGEEGHWVEYICAADYRGAVETLERIRDHANSAENAALLAQNELNSIKGTQHE